MKCTALALLFLTLAARQAVADDHHPVMGDCSTQLNSKQIVPTIKLTAGLTAVTTTIPARTPATSSDLGCNAETYVQVPGMYDYVTFTPTFGGPNITTSDWDCSHSVVQYNVYNADSNGFYSLSGQGTLFGSLVNGQCTHRASNPISSGGDSYKVSSFARSPIIALYSWNHNDTNLGHPGTLCSGTQCYWNSSLTVVGDSHYISSAWDARLCFDIPDMGRAVKNGDPVQLYGCHGGPNQRFIQVSSDATIRGPGGLCLDVPGLGRPPANGDKLQVYQCNGGSNQKFDVQTNGSIKSRAQGGLCLDIPDVGRPPQNNDRVQVYQCNGGDNQRFYMKR